MSNDRPDFDGVAMVKAQMRQQITRTPMLSAARRRRAGRLRWSAAAAAAMVVVAAVVVLAGGGLGGTRAAFAAVRNPDGTVTITLRDLRRIPALNARLADLGTRIRVVPVEHGCVAPVRVIHRPGQPPTMPQTLAIDPGTGTIVSVTVKSDVTAPDRTTVLAATPHGFRSLTFEVAGPAPKCVAYGRGGLPKPFLIPAHK